MTAGPLISIVVAMDRAGGIGKDGDLPWRLSADLRRFKSITMGKPIVMGRRTHESIGRALPGRRNLVLSRDGSFAAADCETFTSLDHALGSVTPGTEAMIIGGAALYRDALPLAQRIYLTEVDATVDADVFFPTLDRTAWHEAHAEEVPADADNIYPSRYVELRRND